MFVAVARSIGIRLPIECPSKAAIAAVPVDLIPVIFASLLELAPIARQA